VGRPGGRGQPGRVGKFTDREIISLMLKGGGKRAGNTKNFGGGAKGAPSRISDSGPGALSTGREN